MNSSEKDFHICDISFPIREESASDATMSSAWGYTPCCLSSEVCELIFFKSNYWQFLELYIHQESIHFRVAVPHEHSRFMQATLFSLNSGIQIDSAGPSYEELVPEGPGLGSFFDLAKPDYLPMQFADDIVGEPIDLLLNALSTLPSEHFVILRLGAKKLRSLIYTYITQLSHWRSRNLFNRAFTSWIDPEIVKDELEGGKKKLEEELGLSSFYVGVYGDSTSTQEELKQTFDSVCSALAIAAHPSLNSLRNGKFLKSDKAREALLNREKIRRTFISCGKELASLWSVPFGIDKHPVPIIKAKELPPLPQTLESPSHRNSVQLGYNEFRLQRSRVFLSQKARRHHLLIHGKREMGKTQLTHTLLQNDLDANRGIILLTTHDEMFEGFLARIPDERASNVLVLDPTDPEFSLGTNIFERCEGESVEEASIRIVELFQHTFQDEWSEDVAKLLLKICRVYTTIRFSMLSSVTHFLENTEYREEICSALCQGADRDYWLEEYPARGAENQFAVSTLCHMIHSLLEEVETRRYIDQPFQTLHMREVLLRDGIIAVKLNRKKLSSRSVVFFANYLIGRLVNELHSRAALNEAPPVAFYLDEIDSFRAASLSNLFVEARKAGVFVTALNEDLGALNSATRSAVLASVSNFAVFQCTPLNAEAFTRELGGDLEPNDFQSLGKGQFYLRTSSLAGEKTVVSVRLHKEKNQPLQNPEFCRESSRARFGLTNSHISDLSETWQKLSQGVR